jgi:hypothetical protein
MVVSVIGIGGDIVVGEAALATGNRRDGGGGGGGREFGHGDGMEMELFVGGRRWRRLEFQR